MLLLHLRDCRDLRYAAVRPIQRQCVDTFCRCFYVCSQRATGYRHVCLATHLRHFCFNTHTTEPTGALLRRTMLHIMRFWLIFSVAAA
jgi:hypothetical protein